MPRKSVPTSSIPPKSAPPKSRPLKSIPSKSKSRNKMPPANTEVQPETVESSTSTSNFNSNSTSNTPTSSNEHTPVNSLGSLVDTLKTSNTGTSNAGTSNTGLSDTSNTSNATSNASDTSSSAWNSVEAVNTNNEGNSTPAGASGASGLNISADFLHHRTDASSKDKELTKCPDLYRVVEINMDECRCLPFNSQILDLSRYYGLKQTMYKYGSINKVGLWKNFNSEISSMSSCLNFPDNLNLKKVFQDSGGIVLDGVKDGMHIAADFANSILQDANYNLEFLDDGQVMNTKMIGNCDQVLFCKDSNKPLLIGKFCQSRTETILNNNGFFVKIVPKLKLGPGAKNLDNYETTPGEMELFEHLSNLTAHMLLNKCRYGYISCGFQTRFVEITNVDNFKDKDGHVSFDLVISNCVGLSSGNQGLLGSLLGMAMLCLKTNSLLVVPTLGSVDAHTSFGEFVLVIQTVSEPKTCSLNRYETPRLGKTKWWKMKKSNEMAASVCMNREGNSRSHDVTGLLYVNREPPSDLAVVKANTDSLKRPVTAPERLESRSPLPAMFKCCSYRTFGNETAFAQIESEAKIYEYLEKLRLEHVPQRYLYGDVLGMIKVLALEPVGRRLTAEDLSEDVIKQVKKAVSELHSHNILHNDMRLCNFYINAEKKIYITNFSKACLYSRLHELVTKDEIEKMELMLSKHI